MSEEIEETSDPQIAVSEVVGDATPVVEYPANVPDGYISTNSVTGDQEKIVYEYDADGNFVGWHKELVSNG